MRRSIAQCAVTGALAAAAALAATPPAGAQTITGLPRVSPHATISQTIGMTEVTIDYHRPAVRDRTVWGGLVPYGQVWRAGANDNTTISFSEAVTIDGEPLAAGTYGLHMIPGEDEWTVIFSNNSTSWGSFSYDQAEDALRVTVQPEAAPFAEWLDYHFVELDNSSALAVLHWAELEVPFQIGTDTREVALAHVREQLRHLPGFSWQGWNSAAAYCVQNDYNYDEALTWAERAVTMNPDPQTLVTKAMLLNRMGRAEEAAATFDQALDGANEGQTNLIGYAFLQAGEVDKAIEVFERNTENHPESWNVWDSLGEAQAAKGQTDQAIANYTKAMNMTEDPAQKARIQGVLGNLQAD